MTNLEAQVSRFRVVATELLKERIAELHRYKDSHLITGKLAKIKVFNTQLDIFRQSLNDNIKTIIEENKGDVALDAALKSTYDEFVNEYMCLSFVREV